MRFAERAPDFAVKVRSEQDYGPAAEQRIADKRADYFAAGTKVVWDVDLQSENVITVYRSEGTEETERTVFGFGQVANAEPAVPGRQFPVDRLSF